MSELQLLNYLLWMKERGQSYLVPEPITASEIIEEHVPIAPPATSREAPPIEPCVVCPRARHGYPYRGCPTVGWTRLCYRSPTAVCGKLSRPESLPCGGDGRSSPVFDGGSPGKIPPDTPSQRNVEGSDSESLGLESSPKTKGRPIKGRPVDRLKLSYYLLSSNSASTTFGSC